MSKIEIDGFLSEEAIKGKEGILDAYEEFFEFAKEVNRYCMKLLQNQKIDWNDNHRLIIQTLFLRAVETFQGIFLLLEIGIMPSAKILTRGMLEIVFTLVALQKKPHLQKKYSNQHEQSYFFNLKSALEFKGKNLRNAAKEHGLENKYIAKKKERKGKKFETLSPKNWAKEAELEDFYNVYYNIYSDSIHCNPSSLDDHVDKDIEELKLAFGPADKDLYETLKCCIYLLINAANSSSIVHGENISVELDKYIKRFEYFDDKFK